ncbi:ribosome small subunit-dependent GTPase A [Eubacterium oxidoreducens]|uniref:Small ribosomal subunit biogenesis GTPase RsgA n=1 Tax=Eubacterium oxidoreducens TaxID=1732 RepID=A0A1G6B676_EUBOX|nr:ribosome small subunit-dependent GTPase A [Eubacterium oxidoreducens]SDB16135.1 ribosome biogenesis GTPase [Eubacterium oxidoreducens]
MQGKIVKGIAGFYYVHVVGAGVYECKAKGIFRKDKIKPLVGDVVEISIIDEDQMTGNVEEILPRKNALIRPAVANIDQALVIFAAQNPDVNYHLLNTFLVRMEYADVPSVICFNKADLITREERCLYEQYFKGTGYKIIFTSAKKEEGIDEMMEILRNRTTTVAGPSGVGKSSLVNLIAPKAQMETGEISEKIKRGRHTTRHAQLIHIEEDTYIFDTPGFSNLAVPDMEKEALESCFPEFLPHIGKCRFTGCAHVSEPDCAVKAALEQELFSVERYEEYKVMYEEIKSRKRY